ncbi:HD domain-containing protein [Candidatus Saccharibacteria bacterium]|nr:HD domain-containing protein [Candidatus Saccharibacteria bacterium]
MDILKDFSRIMENEALLTGRDWPKHDPKVIFKISKQIMEVAMNSFVLRGYNGRYGLTMPTQTCAYESVGAHANLLSEIVDAYLSYFYGEDVETHSLGYSYRTIMKAVRRHDLPENVIGDIPDNGSRDPAEKRQDELQYYQEFAAFALDHEVQTEAAVAKLLSEMEDRSTPAGQMLYCADKVSANIITLCYDKRGTPPRMKHNTHFASDRDKREMAVCDDQRFSSCKASEMWTVDFIRERRITRYDEFGFFVALLVMITLIVNNKWYSWRESDYDKFLPS